MNPRLLVVDDEPSICFAISEFFTCSGYSVDCAHDAAEARAYLADHRYDVLIADLDLSNTDRLEGLELIDAAHAASAQTRIVMLTARASQDVERDAMRRGAAAFLHKPLALASVLRCVRELLGARP